MEPKRARGLTDSQLRCGIDQARRAGRGKRARGFGRGVRRVVPNGRSIDCRLGSSSYRSSGRDAPASTPALRKRRRATAIVVGLLQPEPGTALFGDLLSPRPTVGEAPPRGKVRQDWDGDLRGRRGIRVETVRSLMSMPSFSISP